MVKTLGLIFVLANIFLTVLILTAEGFTPMVVGFIANPIANLVLGGFSMFIMSNRKSRCFGPLFRFGLCVGAAILFAAVTLSSLYFVDFVQV